MAMSRAYRFSGHESFPCRYSWLPKAYRALADSPKSLADEETAMVFLGVGKNMVRSVRFWVQVTGIAEASDSGLSLTEFGKSILDENGLDPFLEDARTLWLLHWRVTTVRAEPLFAWDCLFNKWQNAEFSRTEVLDYFDRETRRLERDLSRVTLEQHFDVFLHTYFPTRGPKAEVREDNLDCPLVELDLLRHTGLRRDAVSGRTEPVYSFNRDTKPTISPEVFAFALDDFWNTHHPAEQTLSFREVAVGEGSPGRVFKLPENDIRERLMNIERDTDGAVSFADSASQAQVRRVRMCRDLLRKIYPEAVSHA